MSDRDFFFTPMICIFIVLFFCSGGTLEKRHDLSIIDNITSFSDLSDYLENLSPQVKLFPAEEIPLHDGEDPVISQNVSYPEVASTGMKTLGETVLLPITPTPSDSGYSYFNPSGTDPSFIIYNSGHYSLGSGFSTTNYSAIRIRVSDVTLDGNGQKISGNLSGYGINVAGGVNSTIIMNFTGIDSFYGGIYSQGVGNIISNNHIMNNSRGGMISRGSNTDIEKNIIDNNTIYGVYVVGPNTTIHNNTISGSTYGVENLAPNLTLEDNLLTDHYGGYESYETGNSGYLAGNSIKNNQWGIICGGSDTTISNNSICENTNNIILYGDNPRIMDNNVSYGTRYNIYSLSFHSIISGNIITHAGEFNILSSGSDTTISGNNASCVADGFGFCIQSDMSDNVTISGNTVGGTQAGIVATGSFATISHNQASDTLVGIIVYDGDGTRVSDNMINDSDSGLIIGGENAVSISNTISNSIRGITFPYEDQHPNVTIVKNTLLNCRDGIYTMRETEGYGYIYDNYLGNDNNAGGDGNFSRYLWTNLYGPERRTNVIGGPFTAGNFWSNPNRTGWSDLQPASTDGYTTTPYEVAPGVYDTAPLVTPFYSVNTTADERTIVFPHGNNSYVGYSNQPFITQAKPGSDLLDVLVDNTSSGSIGSWTFTKISRDHTISTVGQYTPGQVQVLFHANQTYGPVPLAIQFTDQSVGSPTSFYWQFGDGDTSTSQNPIHIYQTPGIYSVTLSAINNQSRGMGLMDKGITANSGDIPQPTPTPIPGSVFAAFTAAPLNGTGQSYVSFQDQSSGNPVFWTWDFGDGQISALQNPTHWYNRSGSYTVTLLAQNENYSGSLSKKGYIEIS